MPAKYKVGDQVTVRPPRGNKISLRDTDLHQYRGMTGEITKYYSISPPNSPDFYVYMVRMRPNSPAIVLHEDELTLARRQHAVS